ncbi:calcium-binding protein [Pseudomonas sp. D2-3]
MSDNNVTAESLFQSYWADVSGALSSTLTNISNNYSRQDFSSAAKRAEIVADLAAQYDHFSSRASELAKSADKAGLDMKKSAQNALDSASLMFKQQADSLRAQGMDAAEKLNADLLSGLNRDLLAKTGGALGALGDVLDIGLKSLEGDYYGAAGAFIGAVASAALAAALVGLTGWITIPLAIGFGMLAGESFEKIFNYLDPLGIKSGVNTDFLGALNFVQRYDPLVLDLDGDGIETVSANSGVVFDFNGDGLKTGTGWIKKDDGFLVLDRNGNGTIDNGSELFGIDTVKKNGQKANSGFDALSDLDSNGDGVFDATDEAFADVRVWQDLNQDGIAQVGELKSLAEHGIAAINLGSKSTSEASNGNLITAVGSFVRTDGSEGVVNGNQSLVANLDLASNPFYREYSNTNPAAADSSLPELKGSGAVRDLREAATLNSGLSSALSAYAQAQTREQQLALVDTLIAEWASTSSHKNLFQRIDDMELGRIPIEFSYSWDVPHKEFASGSSGSGGGGSLGGIAIGNDADFEKGPTAAQLAKKQLLERVSILEIFNGQNFFNFSTEEKKDQQGNVVSDDIEFVAGTSTTNKSRPRGSSGATIPTKIYLTEEDLVFSQGQIDLLNQSYEKLRQSIYEGLLLQTRLKSYVDAISLSISRTGLYVDYSGVAGLFSSVAATDPLKAIIDSFELRLVMPSGPDHAAIASISESRIAQLNSAQLQSLSAQLGGVVIQDGDAAGNLHGAAGSDIIFGKDGSDTVYGGNGNDLTSGGAGNDLLHGGEGNDLLLGGEGNDSLLGDNGNDTLVGGAGNDHLEGGSGSDVYRLERGWGQDTIYNIDYSSGKTDVIEFGADIGPDDIVASRSNTSLVLRLKGSTDSVTVAYYFEADGASVYKLEEIRFADGTKWSVEQIKALTLQGSDGNDYIMGFSTADVIDGGLGNDSLYGADGNDLLKGEAGNDYLSGGNGDDLLLGGEGNDSLLGDNGNDTLVGGAGNDHLEGGSGSDVYRLERGWGQDTIYNIDYSSGKTDVIEFGADIGPDDIVASRSNTSLVLRLKGSTDSVTVAYYFEADGASVYKLEEIRFADGTKWSVEQIKALTLQGSDGNDYIMGFSTADVIDGGLGNDSLYGADGNDLLKGEAGNDYLSGGNGDDLLLGGEGNDSLLGDNGNDTLVGGAGNDHLEGGSGSDVYRLERGWGQDTIYNIDYSSGKTDVIEFGADIGPDDIVASRSNTSLVLRLKGSTDSVTVAYYFEADGASVYKLEEIRFADGTKWSVEQIKALTLQGSDGNDYIMGFSTADVIDGGLGNDSLYGADGNDLLKGEAGNDYLSGGNGDDLLLGGEGNDSLLGDNGNDTLVGGAGNDHLEGGSGSDVYRLERGWGQDTIYNIDYSSGKTDVIEFGADIGPDDIVASRSNTSLVLRLKGSTDSVTVAYYFEADGASVYKLEEIRFADGTKWSVEQIKALTLQGSDGNDYIMGFSTADVIDGGLGNDSLYGADGNDLLKGEAGNDYLSGGNGDDLLLGGEGNDSLLGDNGNDTLVGGAGNDHLEGGSGSDVYRLERGWGQDTIYNIDYSSGKTDAIVFASDITPDTLWFARQGSDLVIDSRGTEDSVTVVGWYSGPTQRLDVIQAGSSSLYANQVDNLVNAMAAFGAPAGGEINLTQAQRDQLNVAIAANWQ